MAELSAIVTIERDGLGRPTCLRALTNGDTLSDSILSDNVNDAVSSVNASADNWNSTYYTVGSYSSTWGGGGVLYLTSVGDVTGPPLNNQTLVYNTGTNKWTPTSYTLTSLADVSVTSTPTNGYVLAWNTAGGYWEAVAQTGGGGGATDLDGLTDVTIATPADNQALIYENATSQWKNKQINHTWLTSIGTNSHSQIDTHISNHATSASTYWNPTYVTVNTKQSNWDTAYTHATSLNVNPHGTDLSQLDDVEIASTPTNYQGLIYFTSIGKWDNSQINHTWLSLTGTKTHATIDTELATAWNHATSINVNPHDTDISQLGDVSLTGTPLNNQALLYFTSIGKWQNAQVSHNNISVTGVTSHQELDGSFNYTTAASANIGSTSSTLLNTSSNWNNTYNYLNNGASANIGSVSASMFATSGNWNNTYNYLNNGASAYIRSTSSTVFDSSGKWTNAYNYLNDGASSFVRATSSVVFSTSSNQRDASSLQGISIKTGTPVNKDILLYNSTNARWEGTNISNVIGSTSRNVADGFTLQGNNGIAITTVGGSNFIVVSGNTISQWDASALRGTALSSTLVPTTNQALIYDGSVWTASSISTGGGGGVTDHGALTGLADDDHPQYVLSATNNALSSLVNNHIASAVHWDIATLNSNYINASGDSANAAFFFQTLSSTTFSATNYLNLPSSTLVWKQAEDIVLYVKNKNATSLPKAKAVTIVSGVGDTPIVEPLSSVNYHVPEALGFANHVIGLTRETITGDSFGYLVVEGIIVGTGGDPLDTSLWNVGDGLYVSSNGELNNIRPPAPYESHPVGFVLRKHATVGSILVKIENAAEINDIVGFNLASSLGDGDLISYDLTTSTFKNVQSVAVSGQGKFGSVSATTYLNLPSSTIVWASATSATNALSATSALNASIAPAGFTVTGTLLATNISATNFSGIDHDTDILNVGTYTHAEIDTHITDTANPHSVTAEQVGNSTAQWNASAIQDIEVKPSFPNDRDILMYSSPFNQWAAGSLLATDVGNTTAQWNASAIRSSPLSSTLVPTTGQSLVYNGSVWTASTVVATGGGGGGISDASSLRGSPLSATLVPTAGQALMYNGSVWTASAALFAYSYGSGAPTGGSDGDIYLQTDVEALQVATVSATTYLNLPSSVITWTNATSATNAFSSTYAFSATNALSSTNAFSSTYALSATSALNAQQAPNGFTVTGTLSSTNLLTTSGDVSAVRLTDYSERKSAPTISSSSLTLDLNAAQVFTVSLNSNISTLTISNTESRANSVQGFTLILTADGTARTITWPGSVKWPSGTGPTLTSTNNKVDILSFVSPDNGTTWYGFIGGQNY